jgi:hypothetical protein
MLEVDRAKKLGSFEKGCRVLGIEPGFTYVSYGLPNQANRSTAIDQTAPPELPSWPLGASQGSHFQLHLLSSICEIKMEALRTRVILSIPLILIAYLLSRSPARMSSVPPSNPWADGPMKLVTTPQYQTKKVIRGQITG